MSEDSKGSIFKGIGYSVFFLIVGYFLGWFLFLAIGYEKGSAMEKIGLVAVPLPFIILNIYGYVKIKEPKTRKSLLITSAIFILLAIILIIISGDLI